MNQASLVSAEQLKMKEAVRAAIYRHFGWSKQKGQWAKGTGRNIPSPINALRIKRHDVFVRKHLGTTLSHSFFNSYDSTKPHEYNLDFSTLPADKFYVAAGLEIEQASGASGADVATLNFGRISQAELKTANATLEMNGKKIFENQPLKNLVVNDDAVPNYLRFPEMVVLEPNNKVLLTLTIKTSVGDYWAHCALKGFMLEA